MKIKQIIGVGIACISIAAAVFADASKGGSYSQTFTQWPSVEPGRLPHYGFNINPSGMNLTIIHQWTQHGWAQVVVSGITNGVSFNATNVVGWWLGSPTFGYDSAGTIIPPSAIYGKDTNKISLKVTLFSDEALTTAISGAKLTVKGETID